MGKTKSRANGDGDVFPRRNKAGKITSYRGAYVGPDGKRRYVSGKNKEEARAKLRQTRGDAERGLVSDGGNVKLSEYLERWLNESVRGSVKPVTHQSYAMLVDKHVVPALGNVRLSKLTPAHLQGFYRSKLDSGLSPRTVQYIHVVLHRALKQALRWGLVVRNVAEAVDPPRVAKKEVTPLSPEQTRAFLQAAHGDRLEALYVLAVHTGMRQGELFNLRWDDVDLDAGVLRVRGTKTARSRRTVTLSETALDALRSHLERQLREIDKAPCGARTASCSLRRSAPRSTVTTSPSARSGPCWSGPGCRRSGSTISVTRAPPSCCRGRPREVRPRTARARHHSDHPGHLQPRTARHGQRDGRRDGRSAVLNGAVRLRR